MIMQYPSKFQKTCYKTQRIFGIPYKGYYMFIEYSLPKALPFDNLNQNNLAHDVY